MNKTSNNYSQWKAMLAITKASLRSISRSPSAVVFILVFPMVFIIVFGFIGNNRLHPAVGIHSLCDTSGTLFEAFRDDNSVRFISDNSDEELMESLRKGRIDAILRIHSDSLHEEYAEIFTSEASGEKGKFATSVLSNIVDKRNILYYSELLEKFPEQLIATNNGGETPVQLKESRVEGREYKMIDFILPGQLGFSILSAGVFGTAFVFFSLRQTMVLKRFFATPIRKTFIILGETLSRVIFQLAGALVIIIIGKYLFGFTVVNGLITVLNLLLLSALGLIVFMGFGFVVSGIAPNESVIPPIANIVTLPQFLLSGTFFQVDVFPDWLQSVSRLLPLTHLNDALRKVAFEGANLFDLGVEISVILLWGIIVYAAAVRFFRWE